MANKSTNKIEHRALTALETILNQLQSVDYKFNHTDKEMTWDGYILLYRPDANIQSKSSFEGRVPVQIKGHDDSVHKYIGKKRITSAVSLADLRAFATEKGVLYFVVFLDTLSAHVYYSSLYPSKIADFLELAQNKNNKTSISIPFFLLPSCPDEVEAVIRQFNIESTSQGSAYTPTVKDRIRADDFGKLKSVSLSVTNADNPHFTLNRLTRGDICLYGKLDDDKYSRPIEWVEKAKYFFGKEVYQTISIGDEVVCHQYKVIADSDGGTTIVPSPNLSLNFTTGVVSFRLNSSLRNLYSDAQILLKLIGSKTLSIGGTPVVKTSVSYPPEFEQELHFIIDLYRTIDAANLCLDMNVSDLSEKQQRQLTQLVNIRLGAFNSQLAAGYSKYLWKFGDRICPLLIIKSGQSVEIENAVYPKNHRIFLPDEDTPSSRGFLMPSFIYQDVSVLSNLYFYDFDALEMQLSQSEFNEKTLFAQLEAMEKLIHVYDSCGNIGFLHLALYSLGRLAPFLEKDERIINLLQIKYRLGTLSPSDFDQLDEIDCDSPETRFAICVLLKAKEDAKVFWDLLSEEDRSLLTAHPIFTLYNRL